MQLSSTNYVEFREFVFRNIRPEQLSSIIRKPRRFLVTQANKLAGGQTCMHTYIHTCIHTCMHTQMHTYIHTYIYQGYLGYLGILGGTTNNYRGLLRHVKLILTSKRDNIYSCNIKGAIAFFAKPIISCEFQRRVRPT